ncbi:MAG TPA: L-threonylcarbamoyladenylate synthase [Candidatus Saccharimonadia bacterium]|nr:L-threonylcarbamoyladenylate synthase [Candidatus Saccharimonadia bacterium]
MELIAWQEAAERLARGEVGVIPTDTLYGIVGSALKPATVERIYALRKRELDNPMIVLIGDWTDLDRFHAVLPPQARALLERVWPGPVSVVVPVADAGWQYLHRGKQSIAFRMPAKPELLALLKQAGPVVAPSANLAGETPSVTVAEAQAYFGDEVFYVDEGRLENSASALVDARTDPPRILRPAPGFGLQ